MHICLFGSAFDPIHVGHQYMTEQMLELSFCDQVWLVPVNQHPFGKKVQTNGQRVEMLELVIRDWPPEMRKNVRVETSELEKEDKSYSFDTLESLSAQYPQHTFSWLIGSDNLEHFHLWKGYQRLLQKYPVFVYPRKGFPMRPMYEGMIEVLGVPEINVSATWVRELLAKHQSVTGLVHPKVQRYIQENRLYM